MSVVVGAVVVAVCVLGIPFCDDVLCGVSCSDQNGHTAALMACANGHLDVVRWLVTEAGSDARSERDNVSCRCVFSST
jgi:ankyrin repeat protein